MTAVKKVMNFLGRDINHLSPVFSAKIQIITKPIKMNQFSYRLKSSQGYCISQYFQIC